MQHVIKKRKSAIVAQISNSPWTTWTTRLFPFLFAFSVQLDVEKALDGSAAQHLRPANPRRRGTVALGHRDFGLNQ